jgi:hypothetical protein
VQTCKKTGHYAEYCRTPIEKIPKFKQKSTSGQYANDHEDDASKYVFTALQNIESTALEVSTYSLKSDYEDAWILDIGATQHMTL